MRRTFAIFVIAAGLVFLATDFLMNSPNPKVALLYTQKEFIPDFVFRIGSLPLALATAVIYQGNYFAALPVTQENAQRVFEETDFFVVGAHGEKGGVFLDDGKLLLPSKNSYPNIKKAFFNSCEFGQKLEQWQATFPNAELNGPESEVPMWRGAIYLAVEAPLAL